MESVYISIFVFILAVCKMHPFSQRTGILMCKGKCATVGYCESVDYMPATLTCKLQGMVSGPRDNGYNSLKITNHDKVNLNMKRCNVTSKYITTRTGRSVCVPVVCKTETEDIVGVGEKLRNQGKTYICNVDGSFKIFSSMNIAFIVHYKRQNKMNIIVKKSDTMETVFEQDQYIYVGWIGYDSITMIYFWLSRGGIQFGTLTWLKHRIVVGKGYTVYTGRKRPRYAMSDLSKKYIFFNTLHSELWRCSFPPNQCKMIISDVGESHLNIFQRRIFYTFRYSSGVNSINYDGKNVTTFRENVNILSIFTTDRFVYTCQRGNKLRRLNITNPQRVLEYSSKCSNVWWIYGHLLSFVQLQKEKQVREVLSTNVTHTLVKKSRKATSVSIVPVL